MMTWCTTVATQLGTDHTLISFSVVTVCYD